MTPNPQGVPGFPKVDIPTEHAQSVESVVRYLVGQLADGVSLLVEDVEEVIQAVMRREGHGSTGIGRGIAIPHSRCAPVDRILGIRGNCSPGVSWNSIDDQPVQLVVLILSPSERPGEHLRMLELVVRQLRELP